MKRVLNIIYECEESQDTVILALDAEIYLSCLDGLDLGIIFAVGLKLY